MDTAETVRSWLACKPNQALLAEIAGRIARELQRRNLRPRFLDPQTDAGYKDFSDSVLSELALFILDDRARIRAMILAGDRNLPRYLEQAFINRCQDRVRTPQSDPMRYFRKRAGEVLRHADGIYTTTDGAGFLAFSLRPQSEERALPPEVDLCAIPLPGSLAAGLD